MDVFHPMNKSPLQLQTLLVAALVIVSLNAGGIWLLGFGWLHVRDAQRLDQSSAVVEGRVISHSTRTLSKGGQSSILAVEYTPTNQPMITKEFDVGSKDYDSSVATGKANVTYWPDDPHVSRITSFAMLPFQILIGLGIIMIAAGLLCLVHFLRRRRSTP